jgi:hypothetical protein
VVKKSVGIVASWYLAIGQNVKQNGIVPPEDAPKLMRLTPRRILSPEMACVTIAYRFDAPDGASFEEFKPYAG